MPSPGYVTVVGHATMSFPRLAVEKEFAHLLGKKDFQGLTDRQTLYTILSETKNRYLARKMCGQITPYGSGSSPAYILMWEEPHDLDVLIDALKRPLSTTEFDVVEGRIAGMAPPALCNSQELPIIVYSQLYSFRVESFVKSIPRSQSTEKIPAKDFEAAAEETFHRIMRIASNGTGPTRALTYAALTYPGLYGIVAEKYAQNASLTEIGASQSGRNPNHADVLLKFVRRDTLFSEIYRFTVNYRDSFAFLEEPLHASFEIP